MYCNECKFGYYLSKNECLAIKNNCAVMDTYMFDCKACLKNHVFVYNKNKCYNQKEYEEYEKEENE